MNEWCVLNDGLLLSRGWDSNSGPFGVVSVSFCDIFGRDDDVDQYNNFCSHFWVFV